MLSQELKMMMTVAAVLYYDIYQYLHIRESLGEGNLNVKKTWNNNIK